MKVFLLKLDGHRHAFYSEGPREVATEPEASGSTRWSDRIVSRWRHRLDHSDGWVARSARRVWKELQRFVGRDEPLLRGLRKTDSIVIHHPASWTRDEALAAWVAYVKARRTHHALWLLINAVIAPLTIVLAVLPGPNLVGYWFVYRLACHALAFLGIRKALNGRVSIWFSPEPGLDEPVQHASPDHLAQLATDCGLQGLDVFLLDGLPNLAWKTDPDFEPDPARPLHDTDDRGQPRPGPTPTASRPDRSPGLGREVDRCGS